MSRAVNIQATPDHIAQTCEKIGARATTIEALASGGSRVVLSNSVESAAIARHYGAKVIQGNVVRQPLRLRRG
ncbi:hypothetical protein HY78_03790 [Rhizorhabdus wittichii DC-6]|uniref:Uncharacterized protein n=2 Tax=Rhizorhabdus wittichii TaxID=160791 RepID=A0A9J9HFE5_RHIWR|nr:hypothetical protein [Rhizorhabdus wittichii]ABQ70419.1 hypothetical protein Swit_4076 [Rhizorhabdus wittichii RW1]ARR52628.1 hypothetical protein HY78_03790 [Rhizorhabdus wittichii DC-6]QTH24041.1 hypothetical protein HRJ34_11325 [Rhizorhabdus wittichii]